jgi:TPR repeat protein
MYNDREGFVAHDRAKAVGLFRLAAELGLAEAQLRFGLFCYDANNWQRYRWWGEGSVRGSHSARRALLRAALIQGGRVDADTRVVFELGAWLARLGRDGIARNATAQEKVAVKLCVEFHDKCCDAARAAARCWLLVAKRLGVSKDMRLLIARLIWEQRGDWSRVLCK